MLKKVKLAGFKSFPDPTTFSFLSHLTAVVGPNGCGKSNVIDAVRWVMGESHAKHLRGGSLTDVIFSGSTARKPVGQASVELLFDNTHGKFGGEYASYAEIAIKRQVTRDGQSQYFLNGQRCRRRDVTDIFLGTGLGPRSYAIIEQGMISRVIDAKPEEIRIFIEEAAGISKYKERRKETETRIRHTQDNLARLNDLREELNKQLRHLERQAQAASNYQTWKAQAQTLDAQLNALIGKKLDEEIHFQAHLIREIEVVCEKEQAAYQRLKVDQEKQRLIQVKANETLHEVQKRYYHVGTEIATLEQSVSHHQERQAQLKRDQQATQEACVRLEVRFKQDEEAQSTLQASIVTQSIEHEAVVKAAEEAIESQQVAEQALETWREKRAAVAEAALAPTRQAEAEKAKIAQLERQIQQTQTRQQRLETEQVALQMQSDPLEISVLDEKIALIEDRKESSAQQEMEVMAEREQLRAQLNEMRPQLERLQRRFHETKGQQVALFALRASALKKEEGEKKRWLVEQQLSERCLAEKIAVQAGWEIAVEAVLESFLGAISVEDRALTSFTAHLETLQDAGVGLIEWCSDSNEMAAADRLIGCVNNSACLPEALRVLLTHVHRCETKEEAFALLKDLSPSESVITPEGLWMGKGWIKSKAKTKEESILQREEKIKKGAQLIAQLETEEENLTFQLKEKEEKLKEREALCQLTQQEKSKLQQECMSLQSERRIKQNRIEQNEKRHEQIREERQESSDFIQRAQEEIQSARQQLTQALEQMAHCNEEEIMLATHKESLQNALQEARSHAKNTKENAHHLALQLQTHRTQVEALGTQIERFKQQIEEATVKIKNLREASSQQEAPLAELHLSLKANVEKRIALEEELSVARDQVAESEQVLREEMNQMNQSEAKILDLRDQLEDKKMHWQALSVRQENILEKLKEMSLSLAELVSTLPADIDEAEWEKNLKALEQKIERLGPINLAAVEEFTAANERASYLDAQCHDLTEALTTLEEAIKKIDRETRAKFKETFDKIDQGLRQLFPRLFGGGEAFLSMTGEDLLDTGICLMARPPGKKNSTIQQLSGGEKALTAIALVFSIFELNPAPFCMLDEVDAPLDDNNVGRFCNLVKEMSKSVQFIYVSHNKLAIEMAEQLQGVTMREAGVSRLVTVDMEEAKSLAEEV